MDLKSLIAAIDDEIDRLERAKAVLAGRQPLVTGRRVGITAAPAQKRRPFSEEARARMAEAQRKRWAEKQLSSLGK